MKNQAFKLKIDSPCKQNWDSMKQDVNGKFCSHCSKTVIDFTKLTDNQVVQIIDQTSDKLCGRFTEHQLNRVLKSTQPSGNSYVYKILAGLLLFGLSKATVAADTITKTEIIPHEKNENLKPEYIEIQADSTKNIIQGFVFDSASRLPLDYASILIKGTRTGTLSEADGSFKLAVPDGLIKSDSLTLVITYVGYKTTELTFSMNQLPITTEVLITSRETTLIGDVIIVRKKKWWQFK
jgi:hypothetical protein